MIVGFGHGNIAPLQQELWCCSGAILPCPIII